MEGLDFAALQRLKKRLAAIRQNHALTLEQYVSQDRKGFCHQLTKSAEASLASTATCVSSLVKAGLWGSISLYPHTDDLALELARKKTSAKLPEYNPFSMAFIAEGLLDLREAAPEYKHAGEHEAYVRDIVANKLIPALESGGSGQWQEPGSIAISPYPPSAYLTQLAFRVVSRCGKAEDALKRKVHRWSRSEINKQVALLGAKGKAADPLQLAYALILAVTTVPDERTSPEDKEIFGHALALFFAEQNDEGLWPLSRPMFHYQDVGSAYSFEYELLAQLLACAPLRSDLLHYIPELEKAVIALSSSEYDLDPQNPGKKIAWASGHHPQLEGPESWSTASVYQFAHALDRLVAEGIRRTLFDELGVVYPAPPKEAKRPPADNSVSGFAEKFLDTSFTHPQTQQATSLKETLARNFVYPIARQAHLVERGGQLSDETPMSAILYGPPGTSKTELAKLISDELGWPLLPVDPSYLVQNGLDQIQAMANRLFSMLVETEQVVALLDEFDEMGRDRSRNDNMLSRFITTAMLPKLAAINKERKIVFLLATNYISGFDAAFSRGGRFDMLLQVMPPTLDAKITKWGDTLTKAIEAVGEADRASVQDAIGDLTFAETKHLVKELEKVVTGGKAGGKVLAAVKAAHEHCTLEKVNDIDLRGHEGEPPQFGNGGPAAERPAPAKWRDTCLVDAEQIRIPPALPT